MDGHIKLLQHIQAKQHTLQVPEKNNQKALLLQGQIDVLQAKQKPSRPYRPAQNAYY